MKNALIPFMLVMNFHVLAATPKVEKIKAAYIASSELTSMLKAVEDHFHLTCDHATVSVALKATWKGLCHNETTNLYVRIKSSFKAANDSFTFKPKSLKVTNLFSLPSETQDFVSFDPFVNAYTRSEIVKDFKRFSEDQFQVTCRAGKAKRGDGLFAARFKYKTECKSETKEIDLSVKSKVVLTSDTSFRFDLKSAKIRFE